MQTKPDVKIALTGADITKPQRGGMAVKSGLAVKTGTKSGKGEMGGKQFHESSGSRRRSSSPEWGNVLY